MKPIRVVRIAVMVFAMAMLTLTAVYAQDLPEGVQVKMLGTRPSSDPKIERLELFELTMQPGAVFEFKEPIDFTAL